MQIQIRGTNITIPNNIAEKVKESELNDSLKIIGTTYNINESTAAEIVAKIKENLSILDDNGNDNLKQQVTKLSKFTTTGYNFEGYTIKSYLGTISKECVIGTGIVSEFLGELSDLAGEESNSFNAKIQKARTRTYERIIHEAVKRGANGIIGLNYDYFTVKSNMICVCVNCTLVNIEKDVIE